MTAFWQSISKLAVGLFGGGGVKSPAGGTSGLLPEGLVTFLFTDIVDSCRMKEVMPGSTSRERNEAYTREVKHPHDHLLHQSVSSKHGSVYADTGDGFCFTFSDAEEAVLCALEIQNQLTTCPRPTPLGPLQLRIGIHSGQVQRSPSGYTASAVDMANRVLRFAEPGQVALSPECHALIRHNLHNVRCQVIGEFELKGFGVRKLWRPLFGRVREVRILIVDDHEMVRKGLRSELDDQPDLKIVGEARNGREAVAKARKLKPDVVIMDFTMPELNGREATRQIRKELPDTEVLILTMHESEELAREVIAAGAKGYVLKSQASNALVEAIHALAQHKPYFTTRMGKNTRECPALTPREREIVQLVAEGKSNKEVAIALDISTKTAETHRTNIMRKLDLHSAGDLVRYAIRNKLIEP